MTALFVMLLQVPSLTIHAKHTVVSALGEGTHLIGQL